MRNTPLTPPGAVLGYRRDGRPIHPIAGGSETATEPPAIPAAPATPPAPPVPAPPQPPAPPAPTDPAAGQPPTAAAVDELPPWAQKSITELRAEAAANRVKAKETADALAAFKADQDKKQAAQREAFAKAMGLAPAEPPTAEQLAEQLAAEKTARDTDRQLAQQAAVQLAVFRAAAEAQVDGNALLDSHAFTSTLSGLDPAAPDFQQQVAAAITKAAENPRYQVAPAVPAPPAPPAPPTVPASGAEFSAPPGGPRQWTDADVQAATPAQLQKAINDGLCPPKTCPG
jgi:hypothetical protein